MFRAFLFLIVFIIPFGNIHSQNLGCTDANAINFDENATQNDGSCEYENVTYTPELISDLSDTVNETSGIIVLDNGIWTHNDSGNDPDLYLLDENFNIKRIVHLKNHQNVDWEEITHNDEYVFVGNFGNNNGSRTDLEVLRFEKSLLLDDTVDTIENIDIISFDYPDQTDFQSSQDHNFDCEAFIYFNDSLQLFTKHRGNEYTKHYTLPAEPGNYTAVLKDSLEVLGQVTASHIQGDSLIALIGYRPDALFEPFAFLLWDFPSNKVFEGNKRRISLGTVLEMGQIEAIYFTKNYIGYITAEEITQFDMPARIFEFDFEFLFQNTANLPEISINKEVKAYPNPSNGKLTITSEKTGIESVEAYSLEGKILLKKDYPSPSNTIHLDFPNAKNETIFLKIYLDGDEVVEQKAVFGG